MEEGNLCPLISHFVLCVRTSHDERDSVNRRWCLNLESTTVITSGPLLHLASYHALDILQHVPIRLLFVIRIPLLVK